MGIADIPGRGDKQLATICHVDMVPAGPGWNTDPFALERREGWLLGRGVIDDKGPAVLSLYAGAYLLKHGITPRYTFRALLGCDEEVGMSDVHHYLENHADPDFLFTPDAEFPVCNAEKGQFGATFVSPKIDGGRIVSWSGSEASNAIPSQSICELAIAADELPAPVENADRLEITALDNGHAQIFAHGIGGHASMPEGTINAVGLIVTYLRRGRGCVWCARRAPADACRARVRQVPGLCACGCLWPRPRYRCDESGVWPAYLQRWRHPRGGWPY